MENEKLIKSNEKLAMEVSKNSIIANLILSIFKLFVGIVANSGAMVSDAVHSASDVFSTFIVIIGVKISNKEADEKHQYGHERLECVASIVLAIILCGTGITIGFAGIRKIIAGNSSILMPGILALVAAILSIVVKEGMYWYTKNTADKINSDALMADAWHHRSDALSSVGSLIGILGARMGFPILDSVASVVICIFIVKAAVDIFRSSIDKMTDSSCSEKITEQIKTVILANDGVLSLDEIKTRQFGSKIYVDIEISADGKQTLTEAHNIAENVHNSVEKDFPTVKHCTVHVNPIEE